MLTAWVREAFPEIRSVSSRSRSPSDHSDEVKKGAVVGLYCRSESAAAAAKKVGVSRETLYAWKNQLLGAEALATMKRKTMLPLDPEIADPELQREAWQRAIYALRIEYDLLKTASDLIKRILAAACRA